MLTRSATVAPLWDYPPQVVIDEDGETRLIPPERVRDSVVGRMMLAEGTREACGPVSDIIIPGV